MCLLCETREAQVDVLRYKTARYGKMRMCLECMGRYAKTERSGVGDARAVRSADPDDVTEMFGLHDEYMFCRACGMIATCSEPNCGELTCARCGTWYKWEPTTRARLAGRKKTHDGYCDRLLYAAITCASYLTVAFILCIVLEVPVLRRVFLASPGDTVLPTIGEWVKVTNVVEHNAFAVVISGHSSRTYGTKGFFKVGITNHWDDRACAGRPLPEEVHEYVFNKRTYYTFGIVNTDHCPATDPARASPGFHRYGHHGITFVFHDANARDTAREFIIDRLRRQGCDPETGERIDASSYVPFSFID